MNQDYRKQQHESEDEELAQLFKIIGARPALPEQLKSRWSGAFRAELDKEVRKRRRKFLAIGGICAGVALLTLSVASFINRDINPKPYIAELASFKGTIALDGNRLANHQGIMKIKPRDFIETESNSYARITYQAKDLRLNENTAIQLFHDKLVLLAGDIYISATESAGVRVIAGSTEIRDVGTQFLVTKNNRGVLTQVRDGAIKVKAPSGEHLITAGDSAKRLEVLPSGNVRISDINAFGAGWDWIVNLSPGFSIEGRTAYAFLGWSSRETGRPLMFVDERAEQVAKSTILHGDISVTNPEQAVDIVLATTRLIARRTNSGQLEISLPEE